MKTLARASRLVLFISLSTSVLLAQWIQSNGPYGGSVYSIAASGTNLFVGTDGGIFRSTDNGGTWAAVNTGLLLTNNSVRVLAATGTNLLAGTDHGLLLSTNNGASWTKTLLGYADVSINDFVIHGSSIFAAAGVHGVFRSTNNGVTWTQLSSGWVSIGYGANALTYVGSTLIESNGGYIERSTNDGSNWSSVSTSGLSTSDINVLAANGPNLFAGTYTGVFLSTDNGTTWTATGSELTNTMIRSLAFVDTYIFAASDKGVYRSSNNGASWTNVGLAPPEFVQTMFASGTNLFAGGAGVFVSTNKGSSWTSANTGLSILPVDVTALASRSTTLFAGTKDRVFASNDNGLNWTAPGPGLRGKQIYTLAVRGGNVLAGTDSGVFISSDDGRNWSMSNVGLTHLIVGSFLSRGAFLFAGAVRGGVFRSTDDGATWTAINDGLGVIVDNPVTGLAGIGRALFVSLQYSTAGGGYAGVYVSFDNGTHWVSTGLSTVGVTTLAVIGRNLFAVSHGVQRSTDNGTTWTSAGLADQTVSSLATIGVNLFAGTRGGDVFRSTDYGTSWTAITEDLPSGQVRSLGVVGPNLYSVIASKGLFFSSNCVSWADVNSDLFSAAVVHSFAVDGQTLYAGTANGGVFLSPDAGVSWQAVNAGLGTSDVLAVTVAGGNVFAGTNGDGVFRSTDGGTTWSIVNSGLTNNEVHALAVGLVGDHASDIIAGTWGGGIFISGDGGVSWIASNIGLTNSYINAIAVSPTGTGQNLFAGTSGGGVLLSRDNGKSWSAVNTGLSNNYIYALAANGANLFAGTAGGVFVSTDNGASWTIANSGITNKDVRSLVASGTNLIAGTNGGGVFLSSDNGNTWTPENTGLPNMYVTALGIAPGALMAGTWGSGAYRWDGIGSIDANISPAVAGLLFDRGFWVEVRVGDPIAVSDLYSVSFKLKSSQANWGYIDGSATAGTLLGVGATTAFQKIDAQTVSMQVAKAKAPGVTGTGVVAKAQFVSPSNSSSRVLFTLSDVVASGSTGNVVQLSPGTLIVQASSTLSVWPGDCNNNGTVSASDLLPIGLYYGQSYGDQNGPGSQWLAYTRWSWPGDTAGKVAYADANGDGMINSADVLPIGMHFGKTHGGTVGKVSLASKSATQDPDGSLTVGALMRQTPSDDRVHVPILLKVKKPVYGIAFNVKYSGGGTSAAKIVEVDTSGTALAGGLLISWISDEGADVGMTKVDKVGCTAEGRLMDLVMDVPVGRESEIRFEICNVTANDADGKSVNIAGLVYPAVATGVDDQVPLSFGLQQNYPNPFNPSTTIEVSVPEPAHLVMKVYDVLGREVVTLLEGERVPGIYHVSWDGRNTGRVPVNSGVYYCRLTAQGASGKTFMQTRQMVVVK